METDLKRNEPQGRINGADSSKKSLLSPGLLELLPLEYDQSLASLDLGRLFQWVLCFAVVNFDLERGHALELTYPSIPFSADERKTLCFSAFPDSNSTDNTGDSTYHFRMRNSEFTQKLYLKQRMSNEQTFDSANYSGLPIDTDGFTYCAVFFRQQRDSDVKRGFFQKALVILSPHCWPGLFQYMVTKMGPIVMQKMVESRLIDRATPNGVQDINDLEIIQNVCHEIASWVSPPFCWSSEQHFDNMTLPIVLMGKEALFSFPPTALFPQLYPIKDKYQTMVDFEKTKPLLCNPGKFYQLFHHFLMHLWTCWELMVLGQPIYVLADSPSTSSQIVIALVELIKPVQYGGDFRPYFTIQDSDFSSLASRNRSPPQAVVLGVTNRVFSKLLEHWPNYISTGKEACKNTAGEKFDFLNLESLSVLIGTSPAFTSIDRCSFKGHKNYFSKDKKLLKSILEVPANVKGTDAVNNMIRQHFIELSHRFLQPLNRYFESLVVGKSSEMTLGRLRAFPEIRPFQQDTFLLTIEASAPTLPVASKRPIADFYRAFLRSRNFSAWVSHKTAATYHAWRNAYLLLLSSADIEYWVEMRLKDSVVECIDLMMRLREEINRYAPFFNIEGTVVTAAHAAATPVPPTLDPSIPPSDAPLKQTEEIFHYDDVLEKGKGETSSEPILNVQEIDMTSLNSGEFKRRKRFNTTPNQGKSTSPYRRVAEPTSSLSSSPDLSDLIQKSSTQSTRTLGGGMGDFIPDAKCYQLLLNQLDIVIRLLPTELTMKRHL